MPEDAREERGYSAFISHASNDREAAETIVATLEAKGLTCWVAPRDVRPGAEYPAEIVRGIERSKCFVLVLSAAANRSAHVRREVERAASKGKAIYPVRIEDVPPSPQLEYFVSMHHWLDAWDAVLEQRAGELAAAIQSEEEWIGNKVLERRRRRTLGLGAGIALSVVALVAALVFTPDIRRLFQSDRDRAIAELSQRGIAVSADGAAKAVAAAAVDDLRLLRRAGMSDAQLQDAMTASAAAFFERSRERPTAIEWLDEALRSGLDPNLLLPHEHYRKEAILAAALRAGNAEAVLRLVARGASPHVYQDIWLSSYSVPRLLFPHTYVVNHDKLTARQKVDVLRAYADAGAVFMPFDSHGDRQNDQTISLDRVRDGAARLLGQPLAETNAACTAPRSKARCTAMSARVGADWCRLVADLPVRVFSARENPGSGDFAPFVIHDLLTVAEGKAYVLATESFFRRHMVIEVAADGRRWRIFKFTSTLAGKDHCKEGPRGGRDQWCWRAWTAEYLPERQMAKVDQFADYHAMPDCESQPRGR